MLVLYFLIYQQNRYGYQQVALTDLQLRSLKPADKPYKVSDAAGLYVLVNPGGSRLWRMAYRFGGKQKLLALGVYPRVSLAKARLGLSNAKDLLNQGIDPALDRKANKRRAKVVAGMTFEAVADEWFDCQKSRWSDGYRDRLRGRLDGDLIPIFGPRALNTIAPIEVLDAIRSIEERDAIEMAKRVMQMASAIFRYGVATSRCERDPTADVRGALRAAKPVKHRAALPATDLPEFLWRLEAYDGEPATRIALKLILLTFVRTSELRFAKWGEFEGLDTEAPLWRIPPGRMKMRRQHLVPLPPQAVALLAQIEGARGSGENLFPAALGRGVMSENTMLYALYRMGYHGRATVHGFRSTASTILNEKQFNRDWIEMQLAHFDGGVRSIYNAAEWLDGRREMMLWWGRFVEQQSNGGAEA
jgi:integrase